MKKLRKVEFIRKNIGMFECQDENEYKELTKKRIGYLHEFEDDLQDINGIDLVKKIALIENEETKKIEKISPENLTFLD